MVRSFFFCPLLSTLWESAAPKSKALFKLQFSFFLTPRFKIPLLQAYKLLKVRRLLQPCSVYRSLKHTHMHTHIHPQATCLFNFSRISQSFSLDLRAELPSGYNRNTKVSMLQAKWPSQKANELMNSIEHIFYVISSVHFQGIYIGHCLRHHSIHHSEYIRGLVRLKMGSIFSLPKVGTWFLYSMNLQKGKELLLYIGKFFHQICSYTWRIKP